MRFLIAFVFVLVTMTAAARACDEFGGFGFGGYGGGYADQFSGFGGGYGQQQSFGGFGYDPCAEESFGGFEGFGGGGYGRSGGQDPRFQHMLMLAYLRQMQMQQTQYGGGGYSQGGYGGGGYCQPPQRRVILQAHSPRGRLLGSGGLNFFGGGY